MNKLRQSLASLRTFFMEVKLELVKCSWPTRKELFGQSAVVIAAVILLAAVVWFFDLLVGFGLQQIIH
ncbi:MAG: preprotein translocase subunit SecE [Lentisphaerae bacterium]|nr:preprotein translocase subunit SecE [Lentisphaerota bacterium]